MSNIGERIERLCHRSAINGQRRRSIQEESESSRLLVRSAEILMGTWAIESTTNINNTVMLKMNLYYFFYSFDVRYRASGRRHVSMVKSFARIRQTRRLIEFSLVAHGIPSFPKMVRRVYAPLSIRDYTDHRVYYSISTTLVFLIDLYLRSIGYAAGTRLRD